MYLRGVSRYSVSCRLLVAARVVCVCGVYVNKGVISIISGHEGE